MHIDLDNFQKIYDEKVKPLEKEFEHNKKNIRIKIGIVFALAASCAVFTIANMATDDSVFETLLCLIIITAAVCVSLIGKFTYKAKTTIFPKLFKSIDNNLLFNTSFIDLQNEFLDSNLFNISTCSCISGDNIKTSINNKDIIMYEAKVRKGSKETEKKVFTGLLIKVVLDKPIKHNIKIVYNTTKDFGILKTLFADENKINLENIEFENKYDVYCEDQIYAREVITLTFMEELVQANEKLNERIQFSFKNNIIYITISDLQLINDKSLFAEKIDMLSIAKEINNILSILDTLEYLSLDEKIV